MKVKCVFCLFSPEPERSGASSQLVCLAQRDGVCEQRELIQGAGGIVTDWHEACIFMLSLRRKPLAWKCMRRACVGTGSACIAEGSSSLELRFPFSFCKRRSLRALPSWGRCVTGGRRLGRVKARLSQQERGSWQSPGQGEDKEEAVCA